MNSNKLNPMRPERDFWEYMPVSVLIGYCALVGAGVMLAGCLIFGG